MQTALPEQIVTDAPGAQVAEAVDMLPMTRNTNEQIKDRFFMKAPNWLLLPNWHAVVGPKVRALFFNKFSIEKGPKQPNLAPR